MTQRVYAEKEENAAGSVKRNRKSGTVQKKEVKRGNAGIPYTLQSGFEQKYGVSFDDVRVHYNSPEPHKVQALAYTKGSEVYIGPGQEKYLKHELGHVVQQKLSRVPVTKTVNGQQVNDDPHLEQEADRLGSLL